LGEEVWGRVKWSLEHLERCAELFGLISFECPIMTHCANVLSTFLVLLAEQLIILRHPKLTFSNQVAFSAKLLLTITYLDTRRLHKFFMPLLTRIKRHLVRLLIQINRNKSLFNRPVIQSLVIDQLFLYNGLHLFRSWKGN